MRRSLPIAWLFAAACGTHQVAPQPAAHASTDTPMDDATRYEVALQKVFDHDIDGARADLDTLMRTAAPPVAKQSGELAAQLMMLQSDWGALSALAGSGPGTEFPTMMAAVPAESRILPTETVTLPVPLSASGSPMVLTTINGVERLFFIDTGAGMSVVASDLAEAAGITRLGGSFDADTTTSQHVATLPSIIDELQFGPVQFRNHPALIIDKDALTFDMGAAGTMKIDGVLGWPVIKHLHLELDYQSQTLTLHAPDAHRSEVPNLYWVGYPLVDGRSGDVQLRFGLDTGAQDTALDVSFLEIFHELDAGAVSVRRGGAGGWEDVEARRVEDVHLSLGGTVAHFAELYATQISTIPLLDVQGIIGSDVAQERRMIVDYPCGHFALPE